MSNTVEDQIVAMHFDNKQFETGVAQSLGSIDKLKSAMSFSGAGKGLDDINRSVSGFNMNPMQAAIEGISGKFLALSTIAVTAISNITNKVIDAGLRMGKSLVIDPFTQGFSEYSTNLNSIQTIIANTGAKLPEVNNVLKQLNQYSDKTIYNFGQMAQNIGRFTAAGVKMGPAVDAIKGMANTAALSGATSEQLNSAMYQMSQALSTGVIRLMDWNSLANANMGGQNIQKALMATAEAGEDAGAGMKAAIEKGGNFRDSLQEGWLTGDIFTKTMKVMAGQLNKNTGAYEAFSVAQLKGMGYSQEAAVELNRLSQASIDSATKVKTIGQAYDVIKESIGSGWAQVFQNIFGNFNQSKKLWTGVTKYITDGVASFFGKINKALAYWNKFGGRVEVIEGLKQAFKDLVRFFVPIKNAFKEVFPPGSAKTLVTISKAFHSFFELFRLNVKTMHVIREVFVAVFTAIKAGFSIIGTLFGFVKDLFGLFSGSGAGEATNLLSELADKIIDLGKAFQKSGLPKLQKFFANATTVIEGFVSALSPLGGVIKNVASQIGNLAAEGVAIAEGLIGGILEGFSTQTLYAAVVEMANNIVTWIKQTLGIHSPAETMVPIGVNIVKGIGVGLVEAGPWLLEQMKTIFEGMAEGIGHVLEGIGALVKNTFENMDFNSFMQIVNAVLTAGLLRTFNNFLSGWNDITKSVSGVFNQMTSSLKTMQQKVKSEVIRNIAISVLLLAGAAAILASVDQSKLNKALLAIGGMMAAMFTAMKFLLGGKSSDLTGKGVAKQGAQLISVSVALVGFAASILILAGAVKVLGSMDPGTLKQGLEATGAIVASLVVATAIFGKTGGGGTIFAAAAALLVMSAALVAFAGTMKIYSNLDWGMIVDGGGKAAAVIVGMGLAMQAFGKFAVTGAIGLAIASVGLLILAKALEKVASIKSETLGSALVSLVVLLGAVALAGSAMTGGALGLLAGAAAILAISIALKMLAKIPADELTKSFVFIGLAFTALIVAAGALAPLTPVLLAFGSAMFLVGSGIALAGVGILAFSAALAAIAVVGPAAFQALSDGVVLLTTSLSEAIAPFALASVTLIALGAASIIGAAGLTILSAAMLIFAAALVVVAAAVVIGAASLALLAGAIALLRGQAGGAIDDIVGAFKRLTDIKGTLESVKTAVSEWFQDLKDKFNNGITIVKAALSGIIQGVKDKVTEWKDDMLRWGAEIGTNIIQGVVNGIDAAKHWIEERIADITDKIPKWMRDKMGISSPSKVMRDQVGQWIAKGVAEGISQHTSAAEKSSKELADKSLDAMRFAFNNSRKISDGLKDIRPTITPVLDLTQLARDASAIGGTLSGRHTINTGISGQKAQDISANEGRRHAHAVASVNETYNFNQTINSPKAVNKVDVYRGTKSQFALFREVKG